MWLVRIVPFCREGNGDAQAGLGGEGFDVGAAGEVGLDRRRLAAVIGGTGTGGPGRRSGAGAPEQLCHALRQRPACDPGAARFQDPTKRSDPLPASPACGAIPAEL